MDDLELAVELVNTLWVLHDPPDSLTSTAVYADILVSAGEQELAADLSASDLGRLRRLRERLRTVFHAQTGQEAVTLVNALLEETQALPLLKVTPAGRPALAWGTKQHGYDALAARLAGALASHIASQGLGRLGICAATPCTCVFIDRTRPKTRKYCCDQCNDRASAAAAYYQRKRAATPSLKAPVGTSSGTARRAGP
jgi:predicted RNA-binding Zn ribbon-like protein